MEIDTPGHTGSISHSHPDYVTCYEASPWGTYANEPPAGQVRFDLQEVQDFVAGIFDSTTKILKSSFFGTGGDELNQNCMVSVLPSHDCIPGSVMCSRWMDAEIIVR